MSFFDKIKSVINIPDDDYYDETEDDKFGATSLRVAEERPRRARDKTRESARSERGIDREDRFETAQFTARTGKERAASLAQDPNKVVNIHTTTQLQVVLVKPERFDEVAEIADNLNEKRTVVLNLESANRDVARRLVDFLSGVAYANSGQIKRVANSTFIITPYNVDVMGDLLDELENNGMFF